MDSSPNVLYLKRTPTVTYDYASGKPIPEAIKQYYVQQQLPVRKQSLAANNNNNNSRSSESTKRNNKQASKLHHRHHYQDTIPSLAVRQDDDVDDFNFKDRPPSSIICIRPIDLEKEEDMMPDDVSWDNHSPDLTNFKDISRDTESMSRDTESISRDTESISSDNSSDINQYTIDTCSHHSIALLSEVASKFHKHMTLSTLTKDGIQYHDAFSGKDAIDRLLVILNIGDRLEAIGVGTALRNQNFFHNVNYEPFLIDSTDELYAFKDFMDTSPQEEDLLKDNAQILDLPTGVYTNLTGCYSPTCTDDYRCYSWSCPKKKNLKQSHIQIKHEDNTRLWSQSIPENIVESTLPIERKRQECIYELIYTEQDFVKDLQYVKDFWVEPLLSKDIIEESRRKQFVKDVFYNISDVHRVNSKLAEALEKRQAEKYLVAHIGDIMFEHVCHFQTFVEYGAHQMIGKFTFELEKKRNPIFAKFVEETERKKESRKLELNGYLTKPTTRLGRYNLLLREILKRTPDNNPDKLAIPKVINIIKHYLEKVNQEAGRSENLFNLQQIYERLEFKSAVDFVDLNLEKPGRQLLMKGRMKRKENSSSSDLQVFLFDHYLVFAKIKYEDHLEKYRACRRPIPLELLSINVIHSSSSRHRRASSILPYSTNFSIPSTNSSDNLLSNKSNSFSITFIHHGRKGSPPITLYTTAASIQQIWIQKIMKQKVELAKSRVVFTITPIIQNYFTVSNRVNSTSTVYDDTSLDGKAVIVGADQGVYLIRSHSTISRIIHLEKISQIELMPESQLLVLADKTLWSFPPSILSPSSTTNNTTTTTTSAAKRSGRAVSQGTAFFHVGECLSKTFVCVVKTNTLSATTIRVLEPVMTDENKKTKSLLKRLVVKSNTMAGLLKPYKDLYLPSEASSINLLKSMMCISSSKEIGVVDMKNFGVQALLDPEDEALEFVFSRPDVRPITIYRIQFAEYLVCYNEFAFFVDQRGRFIKSSVLIKWEGIPDSFALFYPYILAFEPDFIEVRHVHSGELEQIIRGKNIRCTSTNTHNASIQGTMDDPEHEGFQLVFQLEKDAGKECSTIYE
ncbi:CNH domain-containing protein [Cokeromyces recurvatus]|uniref:CNH domain-containing protein n=1 Tax=Cokeromyces recurvatus TaxID=90255 RepID=UPI0022205493|nr:CNH domain-containing protein [Cokeromyces recurvatus]KAI7901263.1 CNH domain-containing protein [Cokeromyces recurvatus]